MKKYLSIVISMMLVVALLGMVACDVVPGDTHQHTFSTEWSTSDTEHWHVATCEHTTEVSDRAPHDFNVEVTRVATATEPGEAVRTCKVCGFSKTETLNYAEHQHIIGWDRTRAEHTQKYICCDKEITNPQHGEHTYNDGAICTVCGKYSVVEDAREKLNKGLFSYTLVVENIDLPLTAIAEGNDNDITISSGAFKLGLDENCMLTLVGTFSGTVSEYIEVAAEKKDKVTSDISGTLIVDNNKVYVVAKSTEGAIRWEKYTSGSDYFATVGADPVELYAVYDINKKLAALGVDNFTGIVNKVLDVAYDNGDGIKSIVDAILSVDTGDSFDKWFVKGDNGVYTLNFGVINDFNDRVKDMTFGDLLTNLLGENYDVAIETIVKSVLNMTVGDMLDFLKQQGVDIYEINNKINELIAKYYPGEEKSIEEILSAKGVQIPDGVLFADFIDNKIVRAYTVIKIINMIGKATAEEGTTWTDLTVENVVATVKNIVETFAPQKIYDVVGKLLTKLLSAAGVENTTITGNTVYTLLDEIGSFLTDCVHVGVTLDKGKLVGMTLEVSYKQPAEEPATGDTDAGATDGSEGGETTAEPDSVGETVTMILAQARVALGNITIKLGLGNADVGVNVEDTLAEIDANVKTATPENDKLKVILEGKGFTNVEIAQKDGRDYVTAIVNETGSYYDLKKDDNGNNYLQYSVRLKIGAYKDDIFAAVNYYDRCGKNFVAYVETAFEVTEITDVRYFWQQTGVDLTEEEITALRQQYATVHEKENQYPVLYGKYDGAYKDTIWLQFTEKDGFVGCDERGKECDPTTNKLHEYELVSGEVEKINNTYYTKLVYKCKHCDKTVVYYCSDANKPLVDTDKPTTDVTVDAAA